MKLFQHSLTRLAIVMLALVTISAGTVTSERVLVVGLIGQQKSAWCWAASAQMIIKYYTTSYSQAQCDLVHEKYTYLPTCCSTDVCDGAAGSAYSVFEMSTHYLEYATCTGAIRWDADISSTAGVMQQINLNKPFVFLWNWGGGHTGSHEMVAFGYMKYDSAPSESGVWVNDPLPVATGDIWFHTYSFFCSSTTDQKRKNPISKHNYTFWAHTLASAQYDITLPPPAP
jgi:hypothetical protein